MMNKKQKRLNHGRHGKKQENTENSKSRFEKRVKAELKAESRFTGNDGYDGYYLNH